ncbi:hypothetical protein SU86_000190 [Candidatus Nitrosotenuis cloacae]|uniref:Uncharacterized protein n=1 Tax=Candidatus Nitrosotenuis cloacae TaxID=1603555 RepID=A0A3G1B2V2_9ARCH|nr:hypothetical protein SU86_000190 [Candidatus Nitrosotenuis cloacae]
MWGGWFFSFCKKAEGKRDKYLKRGKPQAFREYDMVPAGNKDLCVHFDAHKFFTKLYDTLNSGNTNKNAQISMEYHLGPKFWPHSRRVGLV